MKRVFISSTLADLEEYRVHAIEAVTQVGLEPILFETMQPGLSQKDVSEIIENELNQSDIIILIIGHMYGSIVPKTGKSFVEIEYEKAKKMNKPILVFLARDDVPWPPESIDIDRTQVREFRDRIIRSFMFRKFSTPEELSTKIAESLIRLKERIQGDEIAIAKSESKIKNVKIVRLLLSSPGDLFEEREAVSKVIFRYNQDFLERRGLFIL